MNVSRAASTIIVTLTWVASAVAQPFPSRPITILNGFPPGGNPDTAARQIAARLEARIGQPVLVENRAGASGTIAASAMAKSKPDGYTLLFGVVANLATAPATMKTPPYNPSEAFSPIIEIASGPYIWLVRSDAPARSFAEFLSWANENPGKLNYGSPGVGSGHHLASEMVKQASRIDVIHVPYRGPSYSALLAGDIQAMFETMPGPLPFLQSGQLRALAVTGAHRLPGLLNVPTFAELGIPNIDASFWWGIVGPAGMPRSVIDRLNNDLATVLADPALKMTFARWHIEPIGGSPGAFGEHIAREHSRWREIVAKSGMQLE